MFAPSHQRSSSVRSRHDWTPGGTCAYVVATVAMAARACTDRHRRYGTTPRGSGAVSGLTTQSRTAQRRADGPAVGVRVDVDVVSAVGVCLRHVFPSCGCLGMC